MSEKTKSIKYHTFTRSWGNKTECRNFAERIDRWLNQFEDSEKPLMLNLLKHYAYYSEKQVGIKVVELYDKFKTTHEIDETFIFAQIQKEYGVGYSDIFFTSFWLRNDLNGQAEKNMLGLVSSGQIPENILFIDDYAGSDDTFISFIKKLCDINADFSKSRIYFLVLQASSIGLKNINDFAISNGISIECECLVIQNRAFLDNCVCKEIEREIKRREYESICTRLGLSNDYKFGYKEIEALISFEYNTPNNTLGVIWQEIDGFSFLFQRHKKRRCKLAEIQKKAKQNKSINTVPPFICDVEDVKLNTLMVYCLAHGRSFSISKACIDFGLTLDQLDDMLNYMCQNSYIMFCSGQPVATDKLKQYLFTSRIKDFKKIYYSLRAEEKVPEYNFTDDKYIPKDFEERFKGYKK